MPACVCDKGRIGLTTHTHTHTHTQYTLEKALLSCVRSTARAESGLHTLPVSCRILGYSSQLACREPLLERERERERGERERGEREERERERERRERREREREEREEREREREREKRERVNRFFRMS